jgi:hypothetical protein
MVKRYKLNEAALKKYKRHAHTRPKLSLTKELYDLTVADSRIVCEEHNFTLFNKESNCVVFFGRKQSNYKQIVIVKREDILIDIFDNKLNEVLK